MTDGVVGFAREGFPPSRGEGEIMRCRTSYNATEGRILLTCREDPAERKR